MSSDDAGTYVKPIPTRATPQTTPLHLNVRRIAVSVYAMKSGESLSQPEQWRNAPVASKLRNVPQRAKHLKCQQQRPRHRHDGQHRPLRLHPNDACAVAPPPKRQRQVSSRCPSVRVSATTLTSKTTAASSILVTSMRSCWSSPKVPARHAASDEPSST